MKKLWRRLWRGYDGRRIGRGFDPARLRERLAALPADDALWPTLSEMLDAYLLSEAQASVTPGMGDGEAHRFRGRVGMLLDLRQDLERAWKEAHTPGTEEPSANSR